MLCRALSTVLALMLSSLASAQIKYMFTGGTPVDLPANNTITLGNIASPVLLHVYDSSGVDDSIVGPLIIRGRVLPGGSLRLQVVSQSEVDAFDQEPTDFILPGLRDLGGIQIQSTIANDTSLRDNTVVSVSIQGDILGDIDVAQVYRIDAVQNETGTFGGTIAGNITARQANGHVISAQESIGYVRAGREITGSITANSPNFDLATLTPYADIARVIVGPTEANGIKGNILAEQGRIFSIFTTGPIGTPTQRSTIRAGNGIQQIRAVEDMASAPVLSKDFHVEVAAHTLIEGHRATFPYVGPLFDGVLTLIETAGGMTGDVHAANIAECNFHPLEVPAPNCPARPGIYAQGTVDAEIAIDYFVSFANIVGGTFLQPVSIGRWIKGAVVATGVITPNVPPSLDGHFQSITIGRGALPPATDPMVLGLYQISGPGVTGIGGNVDLSWRFVDPARWYTEHGNDGGAIDGVVRAQGSIGLADIASLSGTYTHSSIGNGCKAAAPRIETPSIETAIVGDLRYGSIWAGTLEQPTNDPSNDYAKIGVLEVGCVEPGSAVWMKEWDIATISNSMFGNIHVPNVPADRVLRIGKGLASKFAPVYQIGQPFDNALCECRPWNDDPMTNCEYECGGQDGSPEESPASPTYPYPPSQPCPPRAERAGRVWMHQSDGLHGQIVINAKALAHAPNDDLWTGSVVLGESITTPGCPETTIWAGGTQPHQAPEYQKPTSEMGGGAAGLVPYRLFPGDCVPSSVSSVPRVSQPALAGVTPLPITPVRVRFYGPLLSGGTARVERLVSTNPEVWDPGFDAFFSVVVAPGGGLSREITVAARLVQYPARRLSVPRGTYRVVPVNVRCAQTLAPPGSEPQVADFEYRFCVVEDCDMNGQPDAGVACGDTSACTTPPPGQCVADCDDGTGTGTPDGGVTIDDLLYYLTIFAAGDASADIDDGSCDQPLPTPDGGVTIDDLLCFLSRFDAGC